MKVYDFFENKIGFKLRDYIQGTHVLHIGLLMFNESLRMLLFESNNIAESN